MTIEVFVRSRDRRLLGVLDTWTSIDLLLRYCDLSSWQLTIPVGTAARLLASAGNGIVVRKDGVTILSGPTTTYTEQWGAEDPGDGTLVISGKDDLIDLQRNLAEPDPLVIGAPTQAYDRITGPAETVIRSYVARNIGSLAKAGRSLHPMGQTVGLAQGDTVTGNARYTNLLSLAIELALAGGVAFRAVQDTGGIGPLFDVFVPVDRSDTVVFSKTAGNLAAYSYTLSAPTATWVTVAGQGEGVLRDILDVTDTTLSDDWDAVVRVLVDRRDTSDDDDYAQEAVTTLIEGGATAGLSLTPIDTPELTYGVHYGLGDVVSVDIDPSTRVTDVLTAVRITAAPDTGEVISPVVGSGDSTETPALFATLRDLGTRIGLLERRV